jgi:hypothetical protein
MPVPHVNELFPTWFQFIGLLNPGLVPEGHPVWSVAGLVGLDAPVPEINEPVVRDTFRGILRGISFSHEVRRVGLGAETGTDVDGRCECSKSSSEDAKASESGVERRTPGWVFSSLADALLDTAGGSAGLDSCVDFSDVAAILSCKLNAISKRRLRERFGSLATAQS